MPHIGSAKIAAVPSDVFVVDFDGVICNTEPEVSPETTLQLAMPGVKQCAVALNTTYHSVLEDA